ncbi:MAG: cytochrome c [Colwellia sp.]|nr:cytochrome c [Colwellia sp.]
MKLIKLVLPFIIITVSALTLSTFSVSAQAASDGSLVAKGAKLYSENCGRCHNPRPAEEYTKREWSVVMPHMRAKAHMTGKEALAVEAFLASTLTADIRDDDHSSTQDKPQRTGEELVTVFGCQGCHIIKGEGGTLGPQLDTTVADKGVKFVIRKLLEPTFNNAASAMPRYPMSTADKQAIVDYLKSE